MKSQGDDALWPLPLVLKHRAAQRDERRAVPGLAFGGRLDRGGLPHQRVPHPTSALKTVGCSDLLLGLMPGAILGGNQLYSPF